MDGRAVECAKQRAEKGVSHVRTQTLNEAAPDFASHWSLGLDLSSGSEFHTVLPLLLFTLLLGLYPNILLTYMIYPTYFLLSTLYGVSGLVILHFWSRGGYF